MSARAPAVVLGTSYTALPIVRSLGRRGIRVLALDLDAPGVGAHSRHVARVERPRGEAELAERLVEIARDAPAPPVVFPTSDAYLLFLAQRGDALAEHMRIVAPAVGPRLEHLVSKRGAAALFEQHGIPHPRTIAVKASAPEPDGIDGLRFPAILKPDLHDHWLRDQAYCRAHSFAKGLLVSDVDEARGLLPEVLPLGDALLQEWIPGSSEQLYYWVGYRSTDGRMLVSFAGRKRRTYPEGLGTETLLESVRDKSLAQLGEAIFERFDVRGVAGVDVKRDSRDGALQVIEVNWRFGTSDGLLGACGIDLPWLVYCDLTGESVEPPPDYRTGVYWTWLERDIDWMRDHGTGGVRAWLAWLGWYLRERPSPIVLSWRDPGPYLRDMRRLFSRLAKGIAQRLRG